LESHQAVDELWPVLDATSTAWTARPDDILAGR
jgi:hypothetical protein